MNIEKAEDLTEAARLAAESALDLVYSDPETLTCFPDVTEADAEHVYAVEGRLYQGLGSGEFPPTLLLTDALALARDELIHVTDAPPALRKQVDHVLMLVDAALEQLDWYIPPDWGKP